MFYEKKDDEFAGVYTIKGYKGIAWDILGWEFQNTEETEWSGYRERTGNIVAVMVGDDRYFSFDPDEITPMGEAEYCHDCGQVECKFE